MRAAVAASLAAAVALVVAYVALGGGTHEVERPADPCTRGAPVARAGAFEAAERVGLTALNRAACELGVSRERLVLVLAGEVEPPAGLDEGARTDAFRTGLREAVDAEAQAGRLGRTEAFLLRSAIELAPVDALLERLFRGG